MDSSFIDYEQSFQLVSICLKTENCNKKLKQKLFKYFLLFQNVLLKLETRNL